MVKNMNKKKRLNVKPGIVFEDYRTGELTGSPEMIEKIKASVSEKTSDQKCPYADMFFPCTVRGGN